MKKKQYQIPSSVVESAWLTCTICVGSLGSNPPTKPGGDGGDWEPASARVTKLYV